MLLENKVAVIYGGGPISGAVASTFVREGASVFLADSLWTRWSTGPALSTSRST